MGKDLKKKNKKISLERLNRFDLREIKLCELQEELEEELDSNYEHESSSGVLSDTAPSRKKHKKVHKNIPKPLPFIKDGFVVSDNEVEYFGESSESESSYGGTIEEYSSSCHSCSDEE